MATVIYNRGLDELADWGTNTYKFMLMKSGYTPNKDHDYVADVTPASYEITVAGYSRQTAGTKTRTIDDSNDRIVYDCADVDFGTPASGETVVGMILYREVTNDADSILICYYDLGSIPLTGSSFIVLTGTNGVMYLDQGA